MSRGFCRFGMEGQTIQSIQEHHHGQQVLFPASCREVGNGQKWRKATGPNDPWSLSATPCMLLAIALADQSTKLNRAFEGTPISSALKLSG